MPYGHRFVDLLATLRRGTLLEDCSEELNALVAQVLETEKPGELTLKLRLTPQKNDASVIVIRDSLTVKAPKAEVADTIAYVGADGEISRRDPRQPELPALVEQPAAATKGA